MKYAVLKYDYFNFGGNLGDEIQSLAAEQFLPRVDKKFPRDYLKNVSENEQYILILNGYFPGNYGKCFPPSKSIVPIFYGFHLANSKYAFDEFLNPEAINYFKQHEPIGCRDRKTMEILLDRGIEAFYSKCLTLTFPKREKEPENGKIFLVDIGRDIPIPKYIRKDSLKLTHGLSNLFGDEIKTMMARKLLEIYKNNARLVITTKLHCALPCIAMGIPIIFFGDPEDSRISILNDLNVPIYKYKYPKKGGFNRLLKSTYLRRIYTYLTMGKVDWNPKPIDFEEEKAYMIKQINELIKKIV